MRNPIAPFIERPTRASLLARLLRRPRPADALDEVNNLFARTPRVRAIEPRQIEAIFQRYALSWEAAPTAARAKLYRDYLFYCLSDRHLSADELADLEHIREVLRLGRDAVELVHRRVTREVYSRSVDAVLADATVDEDERNFLAGLREHLDIPAAVAENILEMKQRRREQRDAARPAPRPRA